MRRRTSKVRVNQNKVRKNKSRRIRRKTRTKRRVRNRNVKKISRKTRVRKTRNRTRKNSRRRKIGGGPGGLDIGDIKLEPGPESEHLTNAGLMLIMTHQSEGGVTVRNEEGQRPFWSEGWEFERGDGARTGHNLPEMIKNEERPAAIQRVYAMMDRVPKESYFHKGTIKYVKKENDVWVKESY